MDLFPREELQRGYDVGEVLLGLAGQHEIFGRENMGVVCVHIDRADQGERAARRLGDLRDDGEADHEEKETPEFMGANPGPVSRRFEAS